MLRSFAEKRPQDPFPRYALGVELKAAGDAAGARQAFASLVADHPDYIATYGPAAEVLVELGRVDEARAMLGRGIEACTRRNDVHAREHLESVLAEIEARV